MSVISKKRYVVTAFNPETTYNGIKDFDCGDAMLNDYLKKQIRRQFSRDYIQALLILDRHDNDKVVGFVTATLSQLVKDDVPEDFYPHSIPPSITVMKIPMLAIDKNKQRQGLGKMLMRAILDYSVESAAVVKGIQGVSLDALEDKKAFYEGYEFRATSPEVSAHGTIRMLLPMYMLRQTYKNWQSPAAAVNQSGTK